MLFRIFQGCDIPGDPRASGDGPLLIPDERHVHGDINGNAVFSVYTFLKNKKAVDKLDDPHPDHWLDMFDRDKDRAAFEFWYEMHKGAHETLRDFPV